MRFVVFREKKVRCSCNRFLAILVERGNDNGLCQNQFCLWESSYFLYTVGRGPFSSASRSQIMSSRE